MPANSNWVPLIQQYARQYHVDPQAALAVARMEGLGGGIGDGGHAFGPFQLNDAGGVLTGRPGDHRSFAESPAGIMWALQRIGQVAGGLHGQQAINAIVRRFERPANPNAEVAGALRAYGQQPAAAGPGIGGMAQQAAAPQLQAPRGPDPNMLKQRLAQLLIGASQSPNQTGQDFAPILNLIQQRNQALTQPRLPVARAPVAAQGASSAQNTPSAGPTTGGKSLSFLLPFATKYGLTVTSTTGGQHAPHSYHYSGRAVDYGGNPQHMAQLYAYAIAHPHQFTEAFYAGPGAAPFFVKNGRVFPISQLDAGLRAEHVNHVHLAK